jgi:putative hydrolase of the HAD superfamily
VGIVSRAAGAVPPEPAFEQARISALGCGPGEILFFDDMEVNVEAAAALGIRAFVWQDAGTARNVLRRFQINV